MATILVIDDDENNRLLLSTLSKHAGHTVIESASGAQGCEAALETRPDLIIVDLSLPDMPGVEVIRSMRARPELRDCAIALYTATQHQAAHTEVAQAFALRGAIPKPGTPQEILEAIDRALQR